MTTSVPSISVEQELALPARSRSRRIALHAAERRFLLVLFDVMLILCSLIIWVAIRSDLEQVQIFGPELSSRPAGMLYYMQSIGSSWRAFSIRISWIFSLLVLWGGCAFLFECYALDKVANVYSSLIRVICAAVLTATLYVLMPYITPSLPPSRLEALIFPGLLVASLSAWRVAYAIGFARPNTYRDVLVVGTGRAEVAFARAISTIGTKNSTLYESLGYRLLGFVEGNTPVAEKALENVPVLGRCEDLVQIVRRLRPQELVIADELVETLRYSIADATYPQRRRSDVVRSELFEAVLSSSEMGITITTTSNHYEQISGRVPIEHLDQAIGAVLAYTYSPTQRFYLLLRRLFDIGASLAGCLALALVIPLVWLGNRLYSPGPLFYGQERVGQGGRAFVVRKFRSMIVDAEKHTGAVWAGENDPRITPVGRLLRKTRLDELPQFWNILKGEMSLIGPRPERPYFVEQLAKQFPFYRARHAVRPGLTGWAQVKYRYGASVEDSLTKLEYDMYYIKHQNMLIDFEILMRTIAVVLGLKGR